MPAPRVIIELSPSCLAVSLFHKDGPRSHVIRFPAADWGDRWPSALGELALPLAAAVQHLGCVNAEATVIYSAPGATGSVFSCPASVGQTAAINAARLQLASLTDAPVANNPHTLTTLWTDKPIKAAAPDAAAPASSPSLPQTYVLGIADSETRTTAIDVWLKAAGLRLAGLVPGDAPAILEAVATATSPLAPGATCTAVLWFGEHGSVLAAGTPTRLMYVRALSLGTESFVDALTRQMRSRIEGAEPFQLTRDQARTLFKTVGIPSPDQAIPGRDDINGASVLPLIQPLLQRLCTEAKQSVRFGVAEQDRASTTLLLLGPGAAVPRFDAAIERQTQLKLGPSRPDAHATLTSAALASGNSLPTIVPQAVAGQRLARGIRIAAAIGATVSLTITGLETLSIRAELERENVRLTRLRLGDTSQQAGYEQRDKARQSLEAVAALETRIAKTVGPDAPWTALLRLLARDTPEAIELRTLTFTRDEAGVTAGLSGTVWSRAEAPSAPIITGYVKHLAAIPIISRARLGSTQRIQAPDREGQSFELVLDMVPLPTMPFGVPSVAGVPTP